MAESRQHQGLVLRAAKAVRATVGEHQITELRVDSPDARDGAPPIIDGHRPDLYATAHGLIIIGEAKPPWDVESVRTELQLASFTRYVEVDCSRHLLLAVHWASSATASAVVRSLAQDWESLKQRIHILDGRRPLILPVKQKHHATD